MMQDWLVAYLTTQAIEVPIYVWAARDLPWLRRWLFAFLASTITHPLLWFLIPWEAWPYAACLFLGEAYVIILEALWAKACRVPGPWKWSLVANITSAAVGLALAGLP